MEKTKIDDMLIEMISPKVAEIEGKFTRGEGLQQEDINTLLLKSQYNHINHLDMKLDEIAKDNAQLRVDFASLESRVEQRVGALETKVEQRIGSLETKVEQRIGSLETKVEQRISGLENQFSQLRADIQKTINDTIKWYIGGAGVIMFMLKTLDLFIK